MESIIRACVLIAMGILYLIIGVIVISAVVLAFKGNFTPLSLVLVIFFLSCIKK